MLQLHNVRKSFGASEIVKGVELTVHEGEFFSILGPSGSGKTTILRMIGGFESCSSGMITFDGQRIDHLPPHKRQFNTVFQRYALFPHLSVYQNIAFGLEMKKTPKNECHQRVLEALDLVQMNDYQNRSINTLSGGQQQRVALARALVNKPRVLLLDEPLSALDLKLRQQMKMELLSLQRKLKQTFIFITHDQEEALTLSHRIAVMNEGVIEQVGTPQEIYEYPKTPFVAKFIGSMNIIEGEVKSRSSDCIVVQSPLARRPLAIRPSRDGMRPLPLVEIGTPVRLMIRPEKLKVLKSQPGPEQNAFEGVVREALYRGADTQFAIDAKEKSELCFSALQFNSAVSAKRAFSVGDRVFVAWSPEDCLVMGMNGALPLPETIASTTEVGQLSLPMDAVHHG